VYNNVCERNGNKICLNYNTIWRQSTCVQWFSIHS